MKILFSTMLIFITLALHGQTKLFDCVPYFDSIQNRTVYSLVDSMPQFPGGADSLFKFIQTHIQWPDTEIDFEGKVYIIFTVEADGNITNQRVIRGIFEEADKEALNVIDKMPAWIPGKCKKKNVPVRMIIPVYFKLN